jgi:predicted enzyme related to lactoylglutathione lyase
MFIVARIVPQGLDVSARSANDATPLPRRCAMKTYDDVYKTPGAFSWSELMTSDPDKAATFYGSLFGWSFEKMNMGMPYQVVKTDGTSVGGLMGMPPGVTGVPPNWCPYVTVADVDATAKRCAELGGKVLNGPMDIPTVGRFVVLQDPQGAVINAITYTPR